jgi:homoserine kinase type II
VQFGGEHGHLDLDGAAAFVTGYRSLRPSPRAHLADVVEPPVVEAHVRLLDL